MYHRVEAHPQRGAYLGNRPSLVSETRVQGPIWALGMMSGTSLDGADAALIETDGVTVAATGPWRTAPYPADLRDRLRAVIEGRGARQKRLSTR